jgi:hypothetical protein
VGTCSERRRRSLASPAPSAMAPAVTLVPPISTLRMTGEVEGGIV